MNYTCSGCGQRFADHVDFRKHLFGCDGIRSLSAEYQFFSDAARGVRKVLQIWKDDQHPIMSAEVSQLVGEIELGLLGQF